MGNSKRISEYIVHNYRYGLPKGSHVEVTQIDEDRIRFLTPIYKKVKQENID